VDVLRGKSVAYALNWLSASETRRVAPIRKLIESATANARSLQNVEPSQLTVKSICVDEGPIFRYFKPGAMGRANIQRKRLSHMKIILETVSK
jgi:large subunit ribosomal protein L22